MAWHVRQQQHCDFLFDAACYCTVAAARVQKNVHPITIVHQYSIYTH